ncbi:MAG: metal-sensitive transcriptional regulator [Dehalococcoidia bacterium]|nr:metal-sensitive transcriptional regulator [Dehalococcoidia bacterium]
MKDRSVAEGESPATSEDIAALQNRLKRLEGQLRGIQRMLEDGRVCEDVITQVMAARSGIDQVGLLLLDHHLNCCILSDASADKGRVDELRAALRMWMRFSPAAES